MKNLVRIGVIGCGVMGQHHLKVYARLPFVQVVGVADVDEQKLVEATERFQVRGFLDYRPLLEQDLDVVDVVVPTSLHCQVALDALAAGAHIIVEKPIAQDLEHGKKIVEAAQRAGRKLMVGHVERFNPAVERLKTIIDDGLLGKIVSIGTKRVGPYSPRTYDVGVILDLGTHDIDIISYLYQERASSVYAVAGNERHLYEDHASIMMHFHNGKSGLAEVNWLTPHKMRKLFVVGLSGVATLDFLQQQVVIYDREWAREAKVKRQEPLHAELAHFVESVRLDQVALISGEDSLHALAVARSAILSYQTGDVVKISPSIWRPADTVDQDLSVGR